MIDARVNDRASLMTGFPGASPSDIPESALAPTPSTADTDMDFEQSEAAPSNKPAMTTRVFRLSSASRASMKTAAAAYSSNDALQSLFWRHITLARIAARAQGSDTLDGSETTALQFAANMRSKVSPPLPYNFTGNASIGGITKRIPFTDMKASNGLVTAAAAIRSALKRLSKPDYMARVIGLLASRPDPTDEYKSTYKAFLGPDLVSTSWANLDVYGTEWGSLGWPEWFHIPLENYDGAMIVLPRKIRDGLYVMIALESQAMEALTEDAEFRNYADVWVSTGKRPYPKKDRVNGLKREQHDQAQSE